MSKLNENDMKILEHYAREGNRELYWNYLAHREGDRSYGLLALGVVRDDNVPGRLANQYAQSVAREQNGKTMSERQWESFGDRLMREDLVERRRMMERDRPDLALRLPVRQVQDSHDRTFRAHGIDPDAWTPRKLLEAARRHGGEAEAQGVWGGMLDNGFWSLGLGRAGSTTWNAVVRYNDDKFEAREYLSDVGAARLKADVLLSNRNPNRIGAENAYYEYSPTQNRWDFVATTPMPAHIGGPGEEIRQQVTDPKKLLELNDARTVRLERLAMRDDFHPDDRYRAIMRSPQTLAENERAPGETTFARVSQDPMFRQIETNLAELRLKAGSEPSSEQDRRMALSTYAEVCGQGWGRCSRVLPNQQGTQYAAGTLMIAVRDPNLSDPANPRVYFDAAQAANRQETESLQRIEAIGRERGGQVQTVSEQRLQEAPAQGREAPPPSRSIG